MKILGIDGSGLVASVAIVEDDNLIGEYTTGYKKTHSQTLLPMLDELSKMVELDLNSIDAIAVAAGPGSFTGIRIGIATIKALSFVFDFTLLIAISSCSVTEREEEEANSPEPPLLQNIQPLVPNLPSRLGQVIPPLIDSFYTFLLYFFL